MNTLAIIPARGGSKGIPNKNIYPLIDKPLIAWTIEEIKKSKMITRSILSSDSINIINIAKKYGLEAPFIRPDDISSDTTPMLSVLIHAVKYMAANFEFKPDYIILLQPTSPLRTAEHIDEALDILLNSDADSIVSVVKVPHNYNPYSVMELKNNYLRSFLEYDESDNLRQQKPVFYARNGAAIYAFTYECLMEKNSIYGDKILPYEMDREDSIDIDEIIDLELCEYFLKKRVSR